MSLGIFFPLLILLAVFTFLYDILSHWEQPSREGLGVLLDKQLDITQQCVLAAQQASCTLGCNKAGVPSGMSPSALPCEPHHPAPGTQPQEDTELLEQGQGRPGGCSEGCSPSAVGTG